MRDSSADIRQAQVEPSSVPDRSEEWFPALAKIQVWGVIALTFSSFFPTLFHYQEYAFFALFLSAAVMLSRRRQGFHWLRSPISTPFFLLVCWVLVTVPFSIDPAYSFSEWRKLTVQLLVVSWVYAIVRAYGDASTMRLVLAAVVLGTAVVSVHSLVDFVQRGGSFLDRNVRAWAPLAGPTWLSTYMVVAIPFVVVAGMVAKNGWGRAICWLGVLVAFFAGVVSYMRAAWIGLAAQGVALGLFLRSRRILYTAVCLCMLTVAGLLLLAQAGYQPHTFDTVSMQIRLKIWNLSLREILEHPVVGIGYGNDTIAKRFDNYSNAVGPLLHNHSHGTHSLFLMIAMGSGVPALILFAWLLVATCRTLYLGAGRAADPAAHVFLVGTAVMVIGFAVRNLFDYMLAGSLAHLFWTLVAVGLVEASPKPSRDI
jgi:heptosyltransferase-3/putative inorganic carbon (HCO3(-)) transporter